MAPLATKLFRIDIGNATAAFVTAVGRLQSDLAAGQVPAAKEDELAAQGDYDYFRLLETDNSVNASTLDETITDVQPGQTFGGLHAIERDLWVSGDALSDASGLEPQAQVAEFILSRLTLPPEAIGTTGVDELNWVNDVAIPGREEWYSHLDAVDISATIAAADQAFDAVEPLAHQVAPSLTVVVAGRFATLENDVAELGPVTDLPDSALSSTTRLSLSQQVDATADGLAQLSATLVPYGTSAASS
jgi:iron uptake system component EfeO